MDRIADGLMGVRRGFGRFATSAVYMRPTWTAVRIVSLDSLLCYRTSLSPQLHWTSQLIMCRSPIPVQNLGSPVLHKSQPRSFWPCFGRVSLASSSNSCHLLFGWFNVHHRRLLLPFHPVLPTQASSTKLLASSTTRCELTPATTAGYPPRRLRPTLGSSEAIGARQQSSALVPTNPASAGIEESSRFLDLRVI